MVDLVKQYTTRNNMLWVQPDGPGGAIFPLSCADLDELKEIETAIESLQCWNADRSGWDTIGELISPPEKISFTITMPETIARSVLETVNCPFTIYWTQSLCGRVDDFGNIERGEIVQHIRRTGRAFSAVAHRKDDTATDLSIDVEAWPKLLDIDALELGRVSALTLLLGNDIIGNADLRCGDACSTPLDIAETVAAALDSAPAAATGDILFSSDYGETFVAGATDPFGAGFHTKAITRFQYGNGTRWVVGRDGLIGGAVQGQMAYSDNAGTTWTIANIGGAAAQHGPMYGHALFSLDRYRIWCATNLGFIYKSIDGGLTWVAKESGTIHLGSNYCVHFADKSYGIAGGAAGVISLSDDGGETWVAGGIPAASVAQAVWRMDKNVCWAGLANGALYRSTNGGLTWTLQVTGFPAGAIRSMWWVNQYQGFVLHNTAAPLGSVWRTNNGGTSWVAETTPLNTGLNAVWAPTARLVFAIGQPSGVAPLTTIIIKAEAAYV